MDDAPNKSPMGIIGWEVKGIERIDPIKPIEPIEPFAIFYRPPISVVLYSPVAIVKTNYIIFGKNHIRLLLTINAKTVNNAQKKIKTEKARLRPVKTYPTLVVKINQTRNRLTAIK